MYANGLAKLHKGDLAGARAELAALERESAYIREKLTKEKEAPQLGRQRQQSRALNVAPLELKARILAADKAKPEDVLAILKQAIEEEAKLGYSEPPIYPNPTEEMAGRVMLALQNAKEAEAFFTAALERDPGSGRALLGLSQAQQALGKGDEAKSHHAKFVKAWARADAELPESAKAKEVMSAGGSSSGDQRD
jgi:tetratricopeptide (TPR) repeat protein